MILRSSFNHMFGAGQLAMLQEVVYERYKLAPSVGMALFRVENMSSDLVQHSGLSSLGSMRTTPEGTPLIYDDIDQGFKQSYQPVKRTLAIKLTRESLNDDKLGIIKNLSIAIPRSSKNSLDTNLANVLNNGFTSQTSPDGLSLFNDSHVLESGGTADNLGTAAALGQSALSQGYTDFRVNFVDGASKILSISPKKLVVPPQLEAQALQLVRSQMLPGSMDNDINPNPHRAQVEVVVWDRLTSATAWFLLSDKDEHSLYLMIREPLMLEEEYDFDHQALKIAGSERYDIDASDWRGVYGNAGA